jgi:hypothetical protein
VEQRNEVIQADELAGKTKRIDALQRVPQRFARGPDKENNVIISCGATSIGQPARANTGRDDDIEIGFLNNAGWRLRLARPTWAS